MGTPKKWEEVSRLGEGGQSEVFLVRRPDRTEERAHFLKVISLAFENDNDTVKRFTPEGSEGVARAICESGRQDSPDELAALKKFKIPDQATPRGLEADKRLENEVSVLRENHPGLPTLLDHNLEEKWIVTEYFPLGTLEQNISLYKGRPRNALRAFRTLLVALIPLHEKKLVHRDIKPANVFVRREEVLVPGDFGIVYVPDEAIRLTATDERVGPRDYMPPWGDLGARLDEVQPCFDVYMLAKLLWCMIAGKLRLPREYYDRSDYDLMKLFPLDPDMWAPVLIL